MTFQIPDKSAIASVDRAADLLLIYDDSASALKNVVVNTLLDLTSHPVGVDDIQTLTNKTLTTPTLTVNDNVFTIQDNLDTTKKAVFQLSSITTATTRTYTLPDASGTLITTSSTATLTNKTISGGTITNATISNPTLTVDAIAEFTGGNGVAIDGVLLKDSLIAQNNSIDSNAYIDGSIDPEHLVTGTGSSWTWQDWTPTLTNLSGGTQTYAKYIQIGKTVHFRFRYTLAGAGVAGSVSFTLPVTAAFSGGLTTTMNGLVNLSDTGAAMYSGIMLFTNDTTVNIRVLLASGTYVSNDTVLSSTVPHTWANTDTITAMGTYEAA